MKVNVRLFARAREIAGSDVVELELPEGARVRELRAGLCRRFPQLAPLAPHLLVALGTDYADDETPLDEHTQPACFPPVSGG